MEMACEVMLRLSPAQQEGFMQLLALQAGRNAEINEQFFALAGQLGGAAAQAQARKLVDMLIDSGDSLYPGDAYERDGFWVWPHTFGCDGMEICALLADFLAAFEPRLSGIVEGDGDEDPYGFRYSFDEGEVAAEEGFLMDELEGEE